MPTFSIVIHSVKTRLVIRITLMWMFKLQMHIRIEISKPFVLVIASFLATEQLTKS